MKKFLKKHLFSILLIIFALILIFLGVFTVYCLLAGCVVLGIVFLNFGRLAYKKYKEAQDYSEEDDYFDATQFDYDEEVYYIGNPNKPRKEIGKRVWSRLNAKAPALGLYFIGVALISVAVFTVLRAIF